MERLPVSREQSGRSLTRKFLGFISKRKRDEEKKRMDLCRAMRDSSVERLATVIASARRDHGDELHDLCMDAERVLQRLLREDRPHKVTLRERLLLADIEASQPTTAQVPPPEAPTSNSSELQQLTSTPAPRLQALLTLVRPSGEAPGGGNTTSVTSTSGGSSTSQVCIPQEGSRGSAHPGSSSRRLLSALLWEERNVDDPERGWVAFGVSVEAAPVHFEHSRSQPVSSELDRGGGGGACYHRPSSSLSSATVGIPGSSSSTSQVNVTTVTAGEVTSSTSGGNVSATPMRVSLMSLLREAEDGGGIIFMNRQVLERCESPCKESSGGVETDQTCCVCMGRRKGAAFIPCGHTFCRTCSRELQVARGTCPLCNQDIKDILNLY